MWIKNSNDIYIYIYTRTYINFNKQNSLTLYAVRPSIHTKNKSQCQQKIRFEIWKSHGWFVIVQSQYLSAPCTCKHARLAGKMAGHFCNFNHSLISLCEKSQRWIQTVAMVVRAPIRFSSSDFKPKSKFTKKCFYLQFPSLQMDVFFFFSVSIKFFELIENLMFSFSVFLLLYIHATY